MDREFTLTFPACRVWAQVGQMAIAGAWLGWQLLL
jgi:hypothetical protein